VLSDPNKRKKYDMGGYDEMGDMGGFSTGGIDPTQIF
jgi:DnaJ-class molecular chaperone